MIMIARHELEELERLAKAMHLETAYILPRLASMADTMLNLIEAIRKRENETAAFQELMDTEP